MKTKPRIARIITNDTNTLCFLKCSCRLHRFVQFVVFCVLFVASGSLQAQVNVENVIMMGRHALSVDDNLSAIRLFTQAIEARPTHSRAYYLRAYAKFILEDYVGAEADCSKSIELNPFIPESYQLRGLCRLHIKDFRGSISDYRHTLNVFPKDEAALFNTALCHLKLHEPDSADIMIDKFLEATPEYYRAYLLKAEIALEERHDTLLALQWADTIIAQHREEPTAWLLKGEHAFRHKDFELADSFLTEAIRYHQPPNFMHHLMRADARHALNHFGAALEDYDKVIELIPEHFVAHYNRGLLRALVGDDNRAIDDFDFILEKEPDNTLARYNRALLREQTGNLRGAISDYTELIRAYPEFLYGYHARAQLRRRLGDIRGALNDESVLARHNLDIAFAKPRRHSFRKVRQRSEHELDKYDQPISTTEEKTDTVRIFGNNIFGKVQNVSISREYLPHLSLALVSVRDKVQKSSTPINEVEKFANRLKKVLSSPRHPRTGETLSETPTLLLISSENYGTENFASNITRRIDADSLIRNKLSQCEVFMLRSILLRETGDYAAARTMADSAIVLDPSSVLPRLLRSSLALSMAKASRENSYDSASDKFHVEALISVAEADLATVQNDSYALAAVAYNKGCIHSFRGNHTEAIADFSEAIRLDPLFAEAFYNRAVARLLSGGENTEILNDLSQAGQLGLHAAYALMKQVREK